MTAAPKPSDTGLTDADRATADISAALASVYPLQDVNVAFRAIYAAGKAAAFEEAEGAVMRKWTDPTDIILDGDTIDACAAAIRALAKP